ncbi:MAG TPA: OmpH family outer membrane protein [Terriglobia bacterium]|nr:OmpH family outer membrane protein [Terriglobia bacterium]
MRNLITKLAVTACILATPALMLAQSAEKIGVINLQEAIASTQEGKQDLTQLQQKYSQKRATLQQMDKDITALQDRLQNQSSMLSDAERYQDERQINDKQRLLKEGQDDYQYDTQEDEQQIVSTIGAKMMKIVNQYATEQHYALIISNQQNLVLFASKPVDITQDIVKLYDAANPVSSAASSTSKPAPPAPAKH